MKKISIRLLVWLAFAAAMLSCTREELAEPTPQSFVYRFTLAETGTKATMGEDGVFWEAGDQMGLFVGSASSAAADIDVTTAPKTVTLPASAPIPDGTYIYAYYPYVDGNADAHSAKIVIPSAQSGGSVAAMPMAGIPFQTEQGATSGVIHSRNLGAIIDFRVYSANYTGEQIRSITFTATEGDHPVCGEATLDLTSLDPEDEETLALTWAGSNPSSIILTQSAAVAASKDDAAEGHLYMVVAPGTYSGTITITTDVASYIFPFTNKTLERNTIKRYNMNLDGASATRAFTYSIENDRLAIYLNNVEATPYNPPGDYSTTLMTSSIYSDNTSQANRLDWPKPVPVSWTNPTSGNAAKVVYVYNDAARTDLELSVTASSNSATSVDVYNLIPNRTYYYTVTNGGAELTRGAFLTSGRRRMIKVGESTYGKAYANNCRDFGGQRTISGKTIKYGKIFRGSNMDKTSSTAKDMLRNYMHIGLDVDLRTTRSYWGGNTPGAGENILYDALSLGDWHTTETFDSWGELSDATRMHNILTKVFSAVAQGKGVYIHCTVGADRTGYVSMLLESILGVEQGWCDVDYEITSFSGAVDSGNPKLRTGIGNYYYRSKGGETRGVDYIYSLSGGTYGNTFQAKAVNYVVNTLNIPYSDVKAFQDAMLE
ncbi:MAG: tyrosine-protein phosphatase [Bacteroidales bacterium]|nr:tyrosine-protein phosphatase [Bacteroidales bacterium]